MTMDMTLGAAWLATLQLPLGRAELTLEYFHSSGRGGGREEMKETEGAGDKLRRVTIHNYVTQGWKGAKRTHVSILFLKKNKNTKILIFPSQNWGSNLGSQFFINTYFQHASGHCLWCKR